MKQTTTNKVFINEDTRVIIIHSPDQPDRALHRFYSDEVIEMGIHYSVGHNTPEYKEDHYFGLLVSRCYEYRTAFGNFRFEINDRLDFSREEFIKALIIYVCRKYAEQLPDGSTKDYWKQSNLETVYSLFNDSYQKNFEGTFDEPFQKYKKPTNEEINLMDFRCNYLDLPLTPLSFSMDIHDREFNLFQEIFFVPSIYNDAAHNILYSLFARTDVIYIFKTIGLDLSIFDTETDPIFQAVNATPLKRATDILV